MRSPLRQILLSGRFTKDNSTIQKLLNVPAFSDSWSSATTDEEMNKLLKRFCLFDKEQVNVANFVTNRTESTRLSDAKITLFEMLKFASNSQ